MYEKKDTSVWKWIFIMAIFLVVLFSLKRCDLASRRENNQSSELQTNYQNLVQKNEINYKHLKELNKKQTDSFFTNFNSNKYKLIRPETIQQLANRLNCSIVELKNANPKLNDYKPSEPVKKDEVINTPSKDALQGYEKEVLDLTNKERAKAGLTPLKADDSNLNKAAHAKSVDMNTKNYFSHNSPTYGTPFEMMKTFGVNYKSAGENIAQGQKTPQEVVTAWMNSPGHRANIMNASFTHLGVGFVKDGKYYWTQMFISK